jgi:large repetitive protein
MRAHTITTPRPAVLLSLLALGALGLLVGGGAGQSAAAIPAATPPLETTITKGPPTGNTAIWGAKYGKPIREVATFEFTANQTAATFECAVDGKPFSPCTSPLRVGPHVKSGDSTARRRVGRGKHELQVRATLGGVTDATPARDLWKTIEGG